MAQYTVPLLNAALFPTILILRKRDLRITYWNYITHVFSLAVTLCDRVRNLIQGRRGGYTEIVDTSAD